MPLLMTTSQSFVNVFLLPVLTVMKALRNVATEIENVTPQVVTAARKVYRDPDNDNAQRRMEDLKHTWANTVSKLARLIDDVTDPRDYIMAAGVLLATNYHSHI